MIGFFDSGIGGVSVLQAAQKLLPQTDFIYVADSGHAPYGGKTPEAVQARALAIVDFLVAQGAKAVVSACNTATAHAITLLRENYSIPIIGMEPGIKPAILQSPGKKIGVLATEGTLQGEKYQQLAARLAAKAEVEIIAQPCPGLVESIENLDDKYIIINKLKEFINPLSKKGVDTIVLGCTHYPLIKESIAEVAGPSVQIVETAQAVAKYLYDITQDLALSQSTGEVRYYSSGENIQIFYDVFGIKAEIRAFTK